MTWRKVLGISVHTSLLTYSFKLFLSRQTYNKNRALSAAGNNRGFLPMTLAQPTQ